MQSGKGRVQFTGFDMQTPHRRGRTLSATFVARHDQRLRRRTLAQSRPQLASAMAVCRRRPGFRRGDRHVPGDARRPASEFDSAATSRPRASQADTRGCGGAWTARPAVLAFDNMQNRGVTRNDRLDAATTIDLARRLRREQHQLRCC